MIRSLCVFSFCCNFSGIINPIEAKQRQGKGAVGAYGSERTTQSLQDFPAADSEEEAEEVTSQQPGRLGPAPLPCACSSAHAFVHPFSLQGGVAPSVPGAVLDLGAPWAA